MKAADDGTQQPIEVKGVRETLDMGKVGAAKAQSGVPLGRSQAEPKKEPEKKPQEKAKAKAEPKAEPKAEDPKAKLSRTRSEGLELAVFGGKSAGKARVRPRLGPRIGPQSLRVESP